MARGKGKNPKWVYKDGDKHPHAWRDCDLCGERYLGRLESKYCSLRCAGKASNPCTTLTGRPDYFRCVKCGEVKYEDEFDLWARSPTGRKPRCKMCRAEDWLENKTPELLARMLEQNRKWVSANRDKRNAYLRDYRRANHEKVLAQERAWRELNADKLKLREHRRRTRKKGAQIGDVTRKMLDVKWDYWGGLCWMCGITPAEHWDHVKPIDAWGPHMLSNLRPSCAYCNQRKHSKWPFPTAARCNPFGVDA